jgi:hypothetical protein
MENKAQRQARKGAKAGMAKHKDSRQDKAQQPAGKARK